MITPEEFMQLQRVIQKTLGIPRSGIAVFYAVMEYDDTGHSTSRMASMGLSQEGIKDLLERCLAQAYGEEPERKGNLSKLEDD